jgi:ATP-dependent Lon protease
LIRDGGRLSGPLTVDDVHRLVADLHAESQWMRDVSSWIMNQMLQHVATGGQGFALPPMILAGPPGIGKSHFARTLAKLVGVPARMIDVGGGSAGFRISGTEKGWGTAQPGIPVETLIAHRVANPIMIVDEVDKSGTVYSTKGTASSFTTSMLQMLEPGTAQRFECPYYRVPIDMSRVIWIMTANEIKHVPTPLRDRSRVFNLPPLSAEDAITYFGRLTPDCEKDEAWHRCCEFIASRCNRPGGISLRQIRQLAGVLEAPVQNMMH